RPCLRDARARVRSKRFDGDAMRGPTGERAPVFAIDHARDASVAVDDERATAARAGAVHVAALAAAQRGPGDRYVAATVADILLRQASVGVPGRWAGVRRHVATARHRVVLRLELFVRVTG